MKKFTLIILTIIVVLSTAGCNGNRGKINSAFSYDDLDSLKNEESNSLDEFNTLIDGFIDQVEVLLPIGNYTPDNYFDIYDTQNGYTSFEEYDNFHPDYFTFHSSMRQSNIKTNLNYTKSNIARTFDTFKESEGKPLFSNSSTTAFANEDSVYYEFYDKTNDTINHDINNYKIIDDNVIYEDFGLSNGDTLAYKYLHSELGYIQYYSDHDTEQIYSYILLIHNYTENLIEYISVSERALNYRYINLEEEYFFEFVKSTNVDVQFYGLLSDNKIDLMIATGTWNNEPYEDIYFGIHTLGGWTEFYDGKLFKEDTLVTNIIGLDTLSSFYDNAVYSPDIDTLSSFSLSSIGNELTYEGTHTLSDVNKIKEDNDDLLDQFSITFNDDNYVSNYQIFGSTYKKDNIYKLFIPVFSESIQKLIKRYE